jgi:iron(III) transport system ATP-binding protein
MLQGRILKAAYLGGVREVTVETPVGEVFVVSPSSGAMPAPGEAVGLGFGRHGAALLPGGVPV